MPQDAPIPSDLQRWVSDHLPGADLGGAEDVSWSRGDSRVWRVPAGGAAAFVKISPSAKDYRREVTGYTYAARVLAPYEAPRLLAADPGLQAIMSSPLPGRVVRGLPLAPAVERHVHELAGRVLRRWHDHSAPAPPQDLEAVRASIRGQADEAAACLERTWAHLDAAQRSLVRAVAAELPELAEGLPVVYRHGDYSTRNWLWEPEPQQGGHGHGLIDFAMSQHGIAVEEFVWLCGALWVPRPDLKAAYLTGYGRALSDIEERVLRLLTTRLGVSYLHSGLAKERLDLVERGRLILTRMAHEYQ
ncbi:aminoglycoside phosphotransferase family protein [Streptomyces sp. NPDC059003]|uniref:aminoglycoside phosphotransferase family protein n=1 Tax=Streptomyces sp. NPDC059003 TaxID=3346691 RepID=UPI0036926754